MKIEGNNLPMVRGETRLFGANVRLDSRYMSPDAMQHQKHFCRVQLLREITELLPEEAAAVFRWKSVIRGVWPIVDYAIRVEVELPREEPR